MSTLPALRIALTALQEAELLVGEHGELTGNILNAMADVREVINREEIEERAWIDLIARIGIAAGCLYSVKPSGNEHIVRAVARLAAGLAPERDQPVEASATVDAEIYAAWREARLRFMVDCPVASRALGLTAPPETYAQYLATGGAKP
jgi:hypothetical protein